MSWAMFRPLPRLLAFLCCVSFAPVTVCGPSASTRLSVGALIALGVGVGNSFAAGLSQTLMHRGPQRSSRMQTGSNQQPLGASGSGSGSGPGTASSSDGWMSPWSSRVFEHRPCPNQCSRLLGDFRGSCVGGKCVCNTGFYGVDCSLPGSGNLSVQLSEFALRKYSCIRIACVGGIAV